MKIKTLLLVSAAALAYAIPATAQDSGPSDPASATRNAHGDESVANVDEVVVTALKGATSLSRTAAAVTYVSGEVIEKQKVTDVRGVQNLVPAARFSSATTSTRVVMRGIGSLLDFYWIPENVALNLNGTYLGRFASQGAFYDLENIQVLPGPQGVLYGRNAVGGAVLIATKRPTQDLSAVASIDYGNYDLVRAQAAGNLPLTDDLAVRGAFVITRRNGYQSLGNDADHSRSFRLSALYEPTDDLSWFVWGTTYKQTGKPNGTVYFNPRIAGHDSWYLPERDPVTGIDNSQNAMNLRYTNVGTELAYDFGPASVTYQASALNQQQDSRRVSAGSLQLIDGRQHQRTQSLKIDGETGRLDWVAGADWYRARSRYDVRTGPTQTGNVFSLIEVRSKSAFAHGTLKVTDGIRLVGGGRYSHDSLELEGGAIACVAACVITPVNFKRTWNHLDVKGGVEADIGDNGLLYANVQTGYSPGTLNTYPDSLTLNKEVRPQTMLAYTAGWRFNARDRGLSGNVEAYLYQYDNLIVQQFNSAAGRQALFNVPESEVYGVQASLTFAPTPNDTLSVSGSYTHARYGSFQAGATAVNLKGLQMAYSPDYTGVVSYEHRFDLANGAALTARASTFLSSSYWGPFDHTANARQSAYTRTDASLNYKMPGSRWSAGLWIRNIENRAVATAPGPSGRAAPLQTVSFFEPPRTFGLTLGLEL